MKPLSLNSHDKDQILYEDMHLRYTAQSADAALDELLLDKILIYYMAGGLCFMAILWEWLRNFQPREITPVLTSIVFGACLIFCGYRIFLLIKSVKNLKLGRDGKRVVGQYLESLRESGAHVYHCHMLKHEDDVMMGQFEAVNKVGKV